MVTMSREKIFCDKVWAGMVPIFPLSSVIMGKKSRKVKRPKSAVSGASNGDVSGPQPACYFCLEEGDDEEGKPPVRDCSCRGDSAGFAHFSCLYKVCRTEM